MNENELKQLLKMHGWSLHIQKRCQAKFAYAKRQLNKRNVTRYIKAKSKFEGLTPEYVLKRIS